GPKAIKKASCGAEIPGMHFQPGIDKRTNQPGPYGSLMIRGVPRTEVAIVTGLVVAFAGRKRTQPDRSQQPVFHHIEDRPPSRFLEYRIFERDSEQLIGTAGAVVVSTFAIHHVIEITALRVPEAIVERFLCLRGVSRDTVCLAVAAGLPQPLFEQTEGVVPEGINLHCLAPPRRYHPIVHLGVHPGKLISFLPLRQKTVSRVHMDVEPRSA